MFGWFMYLISFEWARQGNRMKERVAKRMMTPEGIKVGVAQKQKKTREEYNQLFNSIGAAKGQLRILKETLKTDEERAEDLKLQAEGYSADFLEAQGKSDKAKMDEAIKEGERVERELATLDASIDGQEAAIAAFEESMKPDIEEVEELQRELETLPLEEARLIGQLLVNNRLIERHQRRVGATEENELDPLDLIRQNLNELSGKAELAKEMGGIDAKQRDKRARERGQAVQSAGAFKARVAAMQAQQAGEAANRGDTAPTTTERPTI